MITFTTPSSEDEAVRPKPSRSVAVAVLGGVAPWPGKAKERGNTDGAATGGGGPARSSTSGDPNVSAYIRQLEERDANQLDERELPTGEMLAAELERFLREQCGG